MDDPILDDFIKPVVKAGKGIYVKNLYNLYVYFWRWALWKTFESELSNSAGIVSFITASSFIDGDAFLGMRKHMREVCDEIWIIDLGGEGRGTRRDENVFNIQTPVAVTVAVRYETKTEPKLAKVFYCEIAGTREEKLAKLSSAKSFEDFDFVEFSPAAADSFRPRAAVAYFDWPRMQDLMPWQISGAQYKRTWPISPSRQALNDRWRTLLQSTDQDALFKVTRDRATDTYTLGLTTAARLPSIKSLDAGAPAPPIVRYGYRSFDRQYAFADNRLGDFLKASLWLTSSDRQIYLATLVSNPLSLGPALTATPYVPDLHFFRGSFGGKDILPLFRDAECLSPNLHPHLRSLLRTAFGQNVTPEDVAGYFYAILSCDEFAKIFSVELNSRQLRVPVTLEAKLFFEAATLGKQLLHLHTFGERFPGALTWPNNVRCEQGIDLATLPDEMHYVNGTLRVGSTGIFAPVSREVMSYQVSGMKVVDSWFGYRRRGGYGRRSSDLNDVGPERWDAEYTTELLLLLNILDQTCRMSAMQRELLGRILASSVLQSSGLHAVPESMRKGPARPAQDEALDL